MAQPKVIAALVVALVLALVAFFVLEQPILAAVVVVVGLVGAFLLIRSAGGTLRRSGSEDFFEVDEVDDEPSSGRSGSGGLATWNPSPTTDAAPLSTWSPGAGSAEPLSTWDPTAEPEAPAAETSRFAEPTAAPEPDEVERLLRPTGNGFAEDTSTLTPFEAAPLAPWDEGGSAEPEVDEQAEIDRAARVLAGDDSRTSLFAAESPINEEVSTADDIMAASEATELHIGGPAEGDDGELAKLLAKVQARLAAYE